MHAFNVHREEKFFPSEFICVDESMSKLYGLGGNWINIGLPHYIAIDRKTENGAEIQNSACGRSGIMIKLKLVKGTTGNLETTGNLDQDVGHATSVTLDLVTPWRGRTELCVEIRTSRVLRQLSISHRLVSNLLEL